MQKLVRIGAAFGALFLLGASALAADPVADFYHGKEITILVGTSAGGAYDIPARILSHYLGKHIPGHPAVIVQNLPGAGGVQAINEIVNIAPEDGTMIGAPESGSALEPVFHLLSHGGNTAKFDGSKLEWLGSIEQAVYLLGFWHGSAVESFDDLKKQEFLVGASSPNTDGFIFPKLVNNIFETRMKIITGYPSNPAIALAMERGEVAGTLFTYGSLMIERPTWLADHRVRAVLQLTLTPFAPLQGVPSAIDLVQNPQDRRVLEVVLSKGRMARPYFMAAGVPAERLAAVRKAYLDTLKDPAFLAEAKKASILVDPVSAETVQKTMEQVYATPEPVLERVRKLISAQE